MSAGFADHFSVTAPDYERSRPRYPDGLFDLIASLVADRERAWDCATGTGQAAGPLHERFGHVVASDASCDQIGHAVVPSGVELFVAKAEQVPLIDACVDLIAVAQALHWFDLEAFFAEATRVLKPGGILAAWTYKLDAVTKAIDAVMQTFYREVIGPYWPPERRFVEDGYASIVFPLSKTKSISMPMSAEWTVDHLLRYIGTWSAVKRYRDVNGGDPLAIIGNDLRLAWGNEEVRRVNWPMTLKIAQR